AAELAVPVRAELAATLADLGHRQRQCALRPVSLGRERLEARVGRLPRPEALLQGPAQRLDEQGERLRRALRDRASRGREALGRLRLSPAILERGLRDGRLALAGQRLESALVARPLAERRAALAALARLAEQLHPDRPLARGYVRVMDGEGRTLTSRTDAAAKDRLVLKFHDGELGATPDGSAAPPTPPSPAPKPPRARRTAGTPARQDDLFE
ncbi:MAG: exodeoxyribonuclease VII large subunit, partial [Alphaproteobacteria bacterium]|nr:exodeoxyribonuclease VII large subunit [Alphaproteobacteria bacterium]